jgi:SAM-dependent methyltransferase
MGRFDSTVAYYSRYREPYPPSFFAAVSRGLALTGRERLLDVGCGPGSLAIGFAPYVGYVEGIDPEPAMLAAARLAAETAQASVVLKHSRIEEFSSQIPFDMVTIGRALHWLGRDAALAVLENVVSEEGRVLICGSRTVGDAATDWRKPYEEARRSWASDPEEKRYRVDAEAWLATSSFRRIDRISVRQEYLVTVADLIGRALSKSNTSPAELGSRRADFEANLISVLQPFSRNGTLKDYIEASALVFARGK